MTKFIELLRRIELRPKRIALPGVVDVQVDELRPKEFPTATVYRIEARFGVDIMVEDGPDAAAAKDYQGRHARAAIASGVYGEIKQKLREQFAETSILKRSVAIHNREAFDAIVRLERAISETIDMMSP